MSKIMSWFGYPPGNGVRVAVAVLTVLVIGQGGIVAALLQRTSAQKTEIGHLMTAQAGLRDSLNKVVVNEYLAEQSAARKADVKALETRLFLLESRVERCLGPYSSLGC